MNILQRAQRDIQRISTNVTAGFATDITFSNGVITKVVAAVQTKHSMRQDENRFRTVAKTATVTVSESALIAVGYPTRNASNEVDMLKHILSWTDVSGLIWNYQVQQNWPDEQVGYITLILDDYDVNA